MSAFPLTIRVRSIFFPTRFRPAKKSISDFVLPRISADPFRSVHNNGPLMTSTTNNNSTFSQIAIRLPKPTIRAIDELVKSRKANLARQGRWSEAHLVNRSTVLRDALERGLSVLAEDSGP